MKSPLYNKLCLIGTSITPGMRPEKDSAALAFRAALSTLPTVLLKTATHHKCPRPAAMKSEDRPFGTNSCAMYPE
jgi:hypothetical protein